MGNMDFYFGQWTNEKIKAATKETQENATIYFDMRPFYKNTQIELENLNKCLFKERPDLILQVEAANNNDLLFLSQLRNIKKLYFANYESLAEIKEIAHLTFLKIYNVNTKTLDIGFLEGLQNLNTLYITGKIKNIEMIGKCTNLETLYLSTTINNYDFMRTLDKIKVINIDSCNASNDLGLMNKLTLEELSLTQISKLENICTLKNFGTLKKLKLSASKLKKLPEMSGLLDLQELELNLMKSLENPEMISTLPSLKKLKLGEINVKLNAEQFYFLTEMKSLREIDFRFMDFNKKRIEKLNKWFQENGKENMVKK